MIAGATLSGSMDADPRVEDLRLTSSMAGASMEWDIVGGPIGWDGVFWVGLDGGAVGQVEPDGTTYQLPPATAGDHRVEVRPIRGSASAPPDLHGDPLGRRPYLRWSPSPDLDVRGYIVRQGGTEIARVEGVVLREEFALAPTTGTGTGRINIVGTWLGAANNKKFTVEATAGGMTSDLPGAGDAQPFGRGDLIVLGDGVFAEVLDEASSYDTGDEWEFWVGPATEWRGDTDLAESVVTYAVHALDEAGNEGDGTSVVIAMFPRPLPPRDASIDGTLIALSLPEAVDEVRLYLNWSAVFEDRTDLLNRDEVFETWAGPHAAGDWSEDLPALPTTGVFRAGFSVVKDDRESFVVIVAHDTAQPDGAPDLAEPSIISVQALPAGEARIRWAYGGLGAEGLVKFRVEAEPSTGTTLTREVVTGPPGEGNVAIYELDFDADLSAVAQLLRVIAIDGDDAEVPSVDAPFQGDATAPGIITDPQGAPD